MEEETQRQGGFDREVRVLRWRAPRARSLRFPGCDGRPGQPDCDVAPTDQGSLVGRPVSDAVFRLVFRMVSRLHPSSLVWVPLNLTLDLCNNAARCPRWGFWKCFSHLRLQGHPWNHKRVHRVYCALRLNLPRRTTRRVPKRVRHPLAAPPMLNQTWALDFMSETLYDGRRIRLLTMRDEGNREGLEIGMGGSLPGRRVVRLLDELVAVHGCPMALRVDNGPEFTAQVPR